MTEEHNPSPQTHVTALEKEIKDLKHNLASAEGRAKNATSNCDYWKAQYEAATNSATPQPNLVGLTADQLCKTPLIEELVPTNDEWDACEVIGDRYDLMKRRVRLAFKRAALATEGKADEPCPGEHQEVLDAIQFHNSGEEE